MFCQFTQVDWWNASVSNLASGVCVCVCPDETPRWGSGGRPRRKRTRLLTHGRVAVCSRRCQAGLDCDRLHVRPPPQGRPRETNSGGSCVRHRRGWLICAIKPLLLPFWFLLRPEKKKNAAHLRRDRGALRTARLVSVLSVLFLRRGETNER